MTGGAAARLAALWRAVVRRLGWFALAPLFLLAACSSQELYRGLGESEANEMVAALGSAGIDASKAQGEDEQWSVAVDQGDFARAVDVLRANGLPREKFDSLGTVFKKESFGGSATSEHMRLIYGLSQELSRTVREMPGVVQARVHLAIPEADALTKEAAPSSAAVFVKYRPGFDVRNQTGAIKTLMANSVEGLSYDRVSVVMVPAQVIAPVQTGRVEDRIVAVAQGALAFVILTVAAVVGWRLWKRRRPARAGKPPVPTGPTAP